MNKYYDTEGEIIIGYFLDSENISYKKQVHIEKIKGDYANYRVADFYIPKYKMYIEFLGMWRNPESKQKYIQKMELYKKNNIPCIYIYPDNLGILKYVFYMRLKEELLKYPALKFQLFKYKLSQCIEYIFMIWMFFSILIVLLILLSQNYTIPTTISFFILAFLLLAFVLSVYMIYKVFKKEKKEE